MIKIDLITGFLGSGKTTFLKKYAEWLMERGLKIGILENDFGAVNVDMMLLQELRGDNCELEMITACCGNDPDAHRRRFKTKLISMGMSGYDRVLIEPSGIFDVDEFFDILHDEPLDRWYEIGNVIAIADAKQRELPEEAAYILATEIADAGCVALSRCQEASDGDIVRTTELLNRALGQVKCSRELVAERDILCRDWEHLTEQDFERLYACGYRMESYEKRGCAGHGGFESLVFMKLPVSARELERSAARIFADPDCGNVFRMKGFVRGGEAGWLEFNATRQEVRTQTIPEGQEVLIVIGEQLQKDRIAAQLAGENQPQRAAEQSVLEQGRC